MAFIDNSDNNIHYSFFNDKKFMTKDSSHENTNQSINKYNLKYYEIKNKYNNIYYENLKGIQRYENFPLFSLRENKQNKNKLILRAKNNSFSVRKSDGYSTSQNSIYITQNASLCELPELPLLFEKIENNKEKKLKNIIKIIKKTNHVIKSCDNNPKTKKLIRIEKAPIKYLFFNKIKTKIEQDEDKKINRSASFITNKKLYELNGFRTIENSRKIYIEKLHEFLNKKITNDCKKERLLRLEEMKRNKLEFINNKIISFQESQKLFNERYIVKCQEFLLNLYREKDKQDNIDNIISLKIIQLKKQNEILEKKINKKLIEKNLYIKWLLLQLQIKKKLIKLPKQYENLLLIKSNIELPDKLKIYKTNIIYSSPEEIISQLNYYENKNIILMENLNKISKTLFPLKDKLEVEININKKITNDKEFKELLLLFEKQKLKNEILTNKLKEIQEDLYGNNKNSSKNYNKLYEKIKFLAINFIGENIQENILKNKGKDKEMLDMLKHIELGIDRIKEKQKFYEIHCKTNLKIAKINVYKDKRNERMALNRRKIYEKKMKLEQNIIEKSRKTIILPTLKVNWSFFKINKKTKLLNNKDNNANGEEIENKINYELLNYEP